MTDFRSIAETYRWHRGLGHSTKEFGCGRIVFDLKHPNVWDANHADGITAESDEQIEGVLEALNLHLGHSDWRVVHTDPFTPDPFVARLALDGFEERPAVIQMALSGHVRADAIGELCPIESAAQWLELTELVALDHGEGRVARLSRAL
jgi:hypothetical protein